MVEQGEAAPDFALRDIYGKFHKLSSHKGRKVLLCFNRYASCPLCRMDIDNLERRQDIFNKAGIDVVCIFPSPPVIMKRYLARNNNQFTLLSDPDEQAYEMFEVGNSCLALTGAFFGVGWGKLYAAWMKGFYPPPNSQVHGKESRLPAEFLIDEQGKVFDLFRACTLDQFMPWERIEAFMPDDCRFPKRSSRRGLRGRKRPDDLDDTAIYMGGDDEDDNEAVTA